MIRPSESQVGLQLNFFGFRDFAKSVAIQNDGKILVGGRCKTLGSDASFDFALARHNTDGSLDSGFGSGGKVSLDLGGKAEELLNMVLVQFDGRIVVVGGTLLGCCTTGSIPGEMLAELPAVSGSPWVVVRV